MSSRPAGSDTQRPRVADLDMPLLSRLTNDGTVWGIDEIREALGQDSRSTTLRLWRITSNYLYGPVTEWPPRGEVLKRTLSGDSTTARNLWWPPHVTMLPPPDFPGRARPRWTAGTIRRWAMQVGRMTPTGEPVLPSPRGAATKAPEVRADITKIDLDRVRELISDDTRWTILDIVGYFGVSESLARHWYRACRNRISRGVTTWPPDEDRRIVTQQDGSGLTWWPPHRRLLPPPVAMDERGRLRFYGGGDDTKWWGGVRYLWRAGDVKKWALTTGRLRPDGTVVTEAVT